MNPAPKPPRKTPKPRRPLLSEKPIKRSGKIKPKPRKPSEFARIYGSKERVEWVKSLPCVFCGKRPSENAHIETGGMGRKADYTKIVPMCHQDHADCHSEGMAFMEIIYRLDLRALAKATEAAWLRVSGTPE